MVRVEVIVVMVLMALLFSADAAENNPQIQSQIDDFAKCFKDCMNNCHRPKFFCSSPCINQCTSRPSNLAPTTAPPLAVDHRIIGGAGVGRE